MALTPKSEVFQFRVDPKLLSRFQAFCDAYNLTVSEALRRSMLNHVEQWEAKVERLRKARERSGEVVASPGGSAAAQGGDQADTSNMTRQQRRAYEREQAKRSRKGGG